MTINLILSLEITRCYTLKIVQYPPTVRSLQPKAPGWPWESCATRLSSTPTAPHHPRLQPLQPSLCPAIISSFYCVLSSQGLSSPVTQTYPIAPCSPGETQFRSQLPRGHPFLTLGCPAASHPAHWSKCSPSLRAGSQSC